ncbi:hypothetical protein [Streptomyces coeruleorubidus]
MRLLTGLGCNCPPDESMPKARAAFWTQQEWRRFPADTTLISPT